MPVGYYRGANTIRDILMQGSPAATLLENFPHDQISTDIAAALVSGVMTSVAIPLAAGDIITTMSVVSGATALATPTHAFMALYSPAGVLLGQSTDVPGQALAANTVLTHTFASAIGVPTSGLYYAGIMIAATTVPSLVGKAAGAIVAGVAAMNTALGFPAVAQSSGSALLATAPPTIATPTNLIVCPYVCLR